MRCALIAVVLVGALSAAAAAQVTRRNMPEAEAQRLLQAPVKIDAKAAAVLRRSAQAYGRLQSLLTESTAGRVKTVTRLKRPRFYHSVQHHPNGEMISLAISDGKTYWDYLEATRMYLQRDAATLSRLNLPLDARPFFSDVSRGTTVKSIKGTLTAREFAFAYAGEEKVAGRPADRIKVSTLVGNRAGWQTHSSVHSYDRKSGLLVQVLSTRRKISIKNTPNAKLPTTGFAWKPVPGAMRSFD